MCARSARAGMTVARSVQAVFDRYLARSQVTDDRRDEVRADLVGALLRQHHRDPLEVLQAAESDTDEAARSQAFLFGQLQPRILDGHLRGGHRELGEAAHLLELLARSELRAIEVLHLSGDATGVVFRIERSDGAHAAL